MNNQDRANRAFDALVFYNGGDIEDCEETVIQDLISDLRHYCSSWEFDFETNNFMGLLQFERECEEEAENIFDVQVCQSCYENHEHHGEFHTDHPTDDTTTFRPLEFLLEYQLSDNTDPETDEGFTVFSKSPCDGCLSQLAGSRWTLQALLIDDAT